MKTIKNFRNELLKRREIEVLLEAEGNPGFAHSLQQLAKKCNVAEDFIVIQSLKSKFGQNSFVIDAFLYDSVKDKNMTEPKKKVKKQVEAGK